ncbi:MAG: acyl-CoA reductase [Robiginitalea sp.]
MEYKDPSYRALLQLGKMLREATSTSKTANGELDGVLERAFAQNPWFTRDACLYSLDYWGETLKPAFLETWMEKYPSPSGNPLTVALILAGNIPLVGFHDMISVLLTGNRAQIKCASNDQILLPYLARKLEAFAPQLSGRISFTDGKLSSFDAVIATGSNNTSRYFEYYFSKKPHIIRKNRHGAAVLTGSESAEDLQGLAADIFLYFGMGCRSVSKLFVPEGFDFDPVFKSFYRFKPVIEHHKYANNYDYNKAVYLMSGGEMLDNGFLILKEDASFGSPIGTLFYETYASEESLKSRLKAAEESLQCVVAGSWLEGSTAFGTAQFPALWDYADGVDTVDFLLKTSSG